MKGICIAFLCLLLALPLTALGDSGDQIVFPGGSIPQEGGLNPDGVAIKKTLSGTGKENYFDLTLEVITSERIETLIGRMNTAVVVVLDQSNTMNARPAGSSGTRLDHAKAAAKAFVSTFCREDTGLGASRQLGFVSFDTHGYTVFPLEEAAPEKEAAWARAIEGIQTAGELSHDRFTNLEAGLQLAKNLLSGSAATNRYVILLTDGFPTTYIKGSRDSKKKIIGFDPYGSHHYAPGEDGYFFDGVEGIVCTATSYSDTAAQRAQTLAGELKAEGINLFSVGIDIGGQTIQDYIDQGKAAGISIVERQDETYVIGDPSSPDSYRRWLALAIGGGPANSSITYCDGDDLEALKAAYQAILEEIRAINLQSVRDAWVAADPLGEGLEFLGFLDGTGALQGNSLTGTGAEGGENTAVFENGTIRWDLKHSGFTSLSLPDGGRQDAYRLRYRVRLKNEEAGFVPETAINTNGGASLTYRVSNHGVLSPEKTLEFPKPQVLGFLGRLIFEKLDSYRGTPLEGVEFTLIHDPACPVCGGRVLIGDLSGASDGEGRVEISSIPSGHRYGLKETGVPAGYLPARDGVVTVSYGETNLLLDGEATLVMENDPIEIPTPTPEIPKPPQTGGRNPLPLLLACCLGLLGIMALTLGYLWNRRR